MSGVEHQSVRQPTSLDYRHEEPPPPTPLTVARRITALLLDIAIFAPPVALLCLAGSFGTEASHASWDPAFVLAAAVAAIIPLCEMLFAGSPGLLIVGGRIRAVPDGAVASRIRLLQRIALKYAPGLGVSHTGRTGHRRAPDGAILAVVLAFFIGLLTLLSPAWRWVSSASRTSRSGSTCSRGRCSSACGSCRK